MLSKLDYPEHGFSQVQRNLLLALILVLRAHAIGQDSSVTNPADNFKDARVSSISIPSPEAGRKFTISISMINSGTSSWVSNGSSACYLSSLSPWNNSTGNVQQISLPSAEIGTNKTASFQLEMTAPMFPGVYPISWQMACSEQRFGETVSRSVVVQPIPEKQLNVDVNNDGKADLVNISHMKGVGLRIHTLFSNGDGTWTEAQDEPWPDFRDDNAVNWKVSDINGDGRADLVNMYRRNSGLRVHALISNGKGSWIRASHDLWAAYKENDMENWKVADINGDRRLDWVDVHCSPDGFRVHSLVSQGDGSWLKAQDEAWTSYQNNDAENWKVSDINGDGKEDLVNAFHTGQSLRIHSLLSKGDGYWTTNFHDVWGNYEYTDATLWKTANLDDDQKDVLINVVQTSSGLRFDFLISKGDGAWITNRQDLDDRSSENNFTTWQTADVHGDQKDEALCFYQAKQSVVVKVFGLDTDGAWKRASHQSLSGSTIDELLKWKIADVNGDGKDDLVQLDCAQSELGVTTILSYPEGSWQPVRRAKLPFCRSSDIWNWRSAR